ncbi:hypothetical protein SMICM17S_09965 [Streptomyces microflavus]
MSRARSVRTRAGCGSRRGTSPPRRRPLRPEPGPGASPPQAWGWGAAAPVPATPHRARTAHEASASRPARIDHGVQPDEGLGQFRREDLLRPPPRPGHTLHDGDVGALQLLRHEGTAPALPDRARRARHETRHGDRDLLGLPVAGVPARHARRLVRRPGLGPAQDRRHRRRGHHARPPDPGTALRGHVLRRSGPRGHRLGPAEVQHLDDGRPPLRRPGRPAPRRRLHDLLHGHQHGRLRCAPGDRHHR